MGSSLKVLVFDLMGTCLDWHSGLLNNLQTVLQARDHQPEDPSRLALAWRQSFFDEIHARFEAGLPQEDIDETHRRTLTTLLKNRWGIVDIEAVEKCVEAWHTQRGTCLGSAHG